MLRGWFKWIFDDVHYFLFTVCFTTKSLLGKKKVIITPTANKNAVHNGVMTAKTPLKMLYKERAISEHFSKVS